MDVQKYTIDYPINNQLDVTKQYDLAVQKFMATYQEGNVYEFLINSESMISTAIGLTLRKRSDIKFIFSISKNVPNWNLIYSFILNTGNAEVRVVA